MKVHVYAQMALPHLVSVNTNVLGQYKPTSVVPKTVMFVKVTPNTVSLVNYAHCRTFNVLNLRKCLQVGYSVYSVYLSVPR